MAKEKKAKRIVKTEKCLIEVVRKVNEYFDDGYEAEIIESDLALFPNGQIWICGGCNKIHVGFHLDTSPQLIGKIAVALSEYIDRLSFESISAFVDEHGDIYEDDLAFLEFGKFLISISDSSNCTDVVVGVNASGVRDKNNNGNLQ